MPFKVSPVWETDPEQHHGGHILTACYTWLQLWFGYLKRWQSENFTHELGGSPSSTVLLLLMRMLYVPTQLLLPVSPWSGLFLSMRLTVETSSLIKTYSFRTGDQCESCHNRRRKLRKSERSHPVQFIDHFGVCHCPLLGAKCLSKPRGKEPLIIALFFSSHILRSRNPLLAVAQTAVFIIGRKEGNFLQWRHNRAERRALWS